LSLSEGPGWRWVFFVNLPVCLLLLVTAAMLLLVYTLVKPPDVGWGTTRTVAGLAGAGALLIGFVVNKRRQRNPLVPRSIFRIKGLAAADATQVFAIAGFYSMFFFLALYMQNVLGSRSSPAASSCSPPR
jgi:MFS family permease